MERLGALAKYLDPLVESEEIDLAKYLKRGHPLDLFPEKKYSVMCVYSQSDRREETWKKLESFGARKKTWKDEVQTIADWSLDGKLGKRAALMHGMKIYESLRSM